MLRAPLLAIILLGVLLAGCVDGEGTSENPGSTGEGVPPSLDSTDWYQYGGESHASVAPSLLPSLDVVGRAQIPEGEMELSTGGAASPLFIPTPHGAATILWDESTNLQDGAEMFDSTCGLFLFEDIDSKMTQAGADMACIRSHIQAYDPIGDQVLACTEMTRGGQPLVRALNVSTGEERWGVSPADAGVTTAAPGDVPYARGLPVYWDCATFSLDLEKRFVLVAIGERNTYRNQVFAIDLDNGEVLWSQGAMVPNKVAPGNAPAPLHALGLDAGHGFRPEGAALTDAGVVVKGFAENLNSGFNVAVLWMSREGEFIGFEQCCSTEAAADAATSAGWGVGNSYMLATNGRLAAMAMDTRLLLIDPLTTTPTIHQMPELDSGCGNLWAAPAWWSDHLIVPRWDTVSSFDSDSGVLRWDLSNPAGWGPIDLLVHPPSDLYMLAGRADPVSSELALFRIDLLDGTILHRIPISAGPGRSVGPTLSACATDGGNNRFEGTGFFQAQLAPLADGGVLVSDELGQLTLLGESSPDQRPSMALSAPYPEIGEAVEVTVELPATEVRDLLLSWGDGTTSSVEAGTPTQHAYAEEGKYTLRLSAVFEDNSTATTMQVVDVGGTPPEELSLLQQAFDPENYDLTFGVLGVLIALFGGLFALYRHQRGRSRIARELQALEKAYQATKNDPVACEAVLAERKAHARGLFADGKLNETQFAVLDRRIDELGSAHRMEAIEDRFAFLSVGMARTLREMLADGKISDWERDHFIAALEQDEYLNKKQKTQVRKQVEAWFGRDSGVEA